MLLLQVQVSGVRRLRPSPTPSGSGRELHNWRPPFAYSNGIQQPPFCRPTGGREGFDSLGSSTLHRHPHAAAAISSSSYGTRSKLQVRLAAGSRSRGPVALELAAGLTWAVGRLGVRAAGTSHVFLPRSRTLPQRALHRLSARHADSDSRRLKDGLEPGATPRASATPRSCQPERRSRARTGPKATSPTTDS